MNHTKSMFYWFGYQAYSQSLDPYYRNIFKYTVKVFQKNNTVIP